MPQITTNLPVYNSQFQKLEDLIISRARTLQELVQMSFCVVKSVKITD